MKAPKFKVPNKLRVLYEQFSFTTEIMKSKFTNRGVKNELFKNNIEDYMGTNHSS